MCGGGNGAVGTTLLGGACVNIGVAGVDADGFEQFAARELPGLLRQAVMLTGDRELANDLVQDAMLIAYRKWERVRRADRPERYVRAIVTRTYLSWRRRWDVRHVELGDGEDLGTSAEAGDHARAVTDRDEVWTLLGCLPRQQRAVLVLRYYQQLTDPEIAEVLRCSPVTVRSYASRALATLRTAVGDRLPEASS